MQTKLSDLGFDLAELKEDLFLNLSLNNFHNEEIKYYKVEVPADTEDYLIAVDFGDNIILADIYIDFVSYNEDSDIDIYPSIITATEVANQSDLTSIGYSMFGKYIVIDGYEDATNVYIKVRTITADEDSVHSDMLSGLFEMFFYLYTENTGEVFNCLRRLSATSSNTIKENVLNIPRKRIRSVAITPYAL